MTFGVLEVRSKWRAVTKGRNALTAEDAEDAEEVQGTSEFPMNISSLTRKSSHGQLEGARGSLKMNTLMACRKLLSRFSSGSSTVSALLFLMVIMVASAAESPSDFAFAVPIEGLGGNALNRVALPAAVYEAAAYDDLRDLRVFNGAGEVVPYAWRPLEHTVEKQSPLSLPVFPLRGPADASGEDFELSFDKSAGKVSLRLNARGDKSSQTVLLGYVIDTSALKTPLSRIDIDWGDARVGHITIARLEAGDDLKRWSNVVVDVPLGALAHAGQQLERKSIEFHSLQAKYLRLMWTDPAQAIELKNITGLPPEKSASPPRAWKEIAVTPVAGKPGEYTFDTGGHFPLDRLIFALPQQNTIVPVRIFSRARPEEPWTRVTQTVLYRLNQNGRELQSPEIALGVHSHRYWMLSVDAASGGIGGGSFYVRAGWTPREIVFTARGAEPFRIAYGNSKAHSGALGIETLVPGWRSAEEPRMSAATTGAGQKLAGEAAARQRIDVRKWALWAALLAGVGVLAWMAWRLSKQLKNN